MSEIHPKLKDVTFIVASDVNNPLCGEGASSVFDPQKGATAEMMDDILNEHIKYYARFIKCDIGHDVIHLLGAGAVGDLGAGAINFQTKFGKTPYGVAQAVKEVSPRAKVIAVAGKIGKGIAELYSEGIDAAFCTAPGRVHWRHWLKMRE